MFGQPMMSAGVKVYSGFRIPGGLYSGFNIPGGLYSGYGQVMDPPAEGWVYMEHTAPTAFATADEAMEGATAALDAVIASGAYVTEEVRLDNTDVIPMDDGTYRVKVGYWVAPEAAARKEAEAKKGWPWWAWGLVGLGTVTVVGAGLYLATK